jgi:dolichol-phosphate mannosyltransferase
MNSSDSIKLAIILPTFNEKENICILINQILELPLKVPFKVIVVDDDSEDLTWKVVEDAYPLDVRVDVIRRTGKTRGLVPSLNDAIKASEAEYILWMDADLQMPVARILDLIEVILSSSATAVIGSRYLPGGTDERDHGVIEPTKITMIHRQLSWLLSRVVPTILSIPNSDVTSGFIVIRRSFFADYELQGMHGEYFIHLAHTLHKADHNVLEIPYVLGRRIHGDSKSTGGKFAHMFKVGFRYLKLTLHLYLKR